MVNRVKAKPGVDQRPKVGIKLLVQRDNQHEAVKAIDEALELGVHFIQFKLLEGYPFALGPERIALIDKLKARTSNVDPNKLYVDILPGYGGREVYERCLMGVLHPVVDWDGEIYMCAFFHHRKEKHSIGNVKEGGFFAHWGTQKHRNRIAQVDPKTCVPNCPVLRYNPVVDFIKTDAFRFRYI
jgi:radical SAM protein with 4Fe4S-binding SPASM domain